MSTIASPTPDMSVNDVLRRWPAAVGALNAIGVDSCCGGAASLEDAAADLRIPVSTLIDHIERALAAEAAR